MLGQRCTASSPELFFFFFLTENSCLLCLETRLRERTQTVKEKKQTKSWQDLQIQGHNLLFCVTSLLRDSGRQIFLHETSCLTRVLIDVFRKMAKTASKKITVNIFGSGVRNIYHHRVVAMTSEQEDRVTGRGDRKGEIVRYWGGEEAIRPPPHLNRSFCPLRCDELLLLSSTTKPAVTLVWTKPAFGNTEWGFVYQRIYSSYFFFSWFWWIINIVSCTFFWDFSQ